MVEDSTAEIAAATHWICSWHLCMGVCLPCRARCLTCPTTSSSVHWTLCLTPCMPAFELASVLHSQQHGSPALPCQVRRAQAHLHCACCCLQVSGRGSAKLCRAPPGMQELPSAGCAKAIACILTWVLGPQLPIASAILAAPGMTGAFQAVSVSGVLWTPHVPCQGGFRSLMSPTEHVSRHVRCRWCCISHLVSQGEAPGASAWVTLQGVHRNPCRYD